MAKRQKPPGSGRKKHDPPLVATLVSLTEDQRRLLRMWGHGDLSAGLRWLIDAAAPMICKPENKKEEKSEKKS